jgi:hypothetical protein
MSELALQHDGAAGKRASHGVPLARTADDDGCFHSGDRGAVQFYLRSNFRGIAPVRREPALAGVSICRVADAAAVFFARAEQRYPERPALVCCRPLLTEVLMLPVFSILFNVPVFPVFGQLVVVLFLGSLGVSIAGTALSAISAQARMRELLLPLLLLPLLTPVLVASTYVTIGLLDRAPYMEWKGIGFLVTFDVVFLTALWLFGEYLLEE